MKNKYTLLIIISALLSTNYAQSSVLYGEDFTSVGITSYVFETPYVNEGVLNTWAPFIAVQYKNFFIRDVELGYQFLNTYQYGAAVSLSGDELNQQRSGKRSKKKVGNVKEGFNIKGSFSLYRPSGVYTLTVMRDISDEHNGIESTFSWLYSVKSSQLTWYPSIYASWMDEKLVQHYFGGFKNSVRDDAYKADSAWRYGAGVTVDYNPSPQWLLQTLIANESYSGQVTKSPLVERSNIWILTLNLGYYF